MAAPHDQGRLRPTPTSVADCPPEGAIRKTILTSTELARVVDRIAHQVLEKTEGAVDTVLLGIPTRGVPLALRLASRIHAFEGVAVPTGSLDITLYRDDLRLRGTRAVGPTRVPPSGIDGRRVILVDQEPEPGHPPRPGVAAWLQGRARPAWRGTGRAPGVHAEVGRRLAGGADGPDAPASRTAHGTGGAGHPHPVRRAAGSASHGPARSLGPVGDRHRNGERVRVGRPGADHAKVQHRSSGPGRRSTCRSPIPETACCPVRDSTRRPA